MATASLGDLVLKITADVAQILDATRRVQSALDEMVSGVSKSVTGLVDEINFVGKAFLIFKGIQWAEGIVTQSISAQAELQHLSEKTGFSVETLSSLSNTAKIVGINIQAATPMLTRFEMNMNSAANGTGRANAAFKELGFTNEQIKEGMRNLGPFFQEAVTRLGNMEAGAGKTAIQYALLGRAGSTLAPLFVQIAENGFEAASVTDQMAKNAEKLEAWWARLGVQTQAVIDQLVGQAVPSIMALGKTFLDLGARIFSTSGNFQDFIKSGTFSQWAFETGKYIAGVIDRIQTMGNQFSNWGQLMKALANLLIDFGRILGGVGEIMAGNFSAGFADIKKGIASISTDWEAVKTAWKAPLEVVTANLREYLSHVNNAEHETANLHKTTKTTTEGFDATKKTLQDATAAFNAYERALAALSKTQVDSLANIAAQGINQQLADLEKSYARGLIDFQSYWKNRIAFQTQQQLVAEERLKDDLKIQEDLVKKSQENVDKLKAKGPATPNQAGQIAFDKELYKAETDLTNAQNARAKAQNALDLQQQRSVTIGRDYYDELVKATPATLAFAKNIQDQDAALKLGNETLGMTASEVQTYTANLNENQLALLQNRLAQGENTQELKDAIAALQALIVARRGYAIDLAKNEGLQKQVEGWKDVLNTAENAFSNILKGGKDTFTQLTEWLKNTLIKALFQLVATKWIIPMIAQVAGPQVGQSLMNSLGGGASNLLTGGGGLSNPLQWGSNFSGGSMWGGIASSSFGQAMGLSSFVETASGDVALQLTSLGSTIGTAIPYIGMAMAALSLFGNLFSKEPSKVKGQFGISAGTTGFEDNAFTASKYFGNMGFLDAGTQQFSGQAAQVFNKVIAGALDAVGDRLNADQISRLRTKLQGMTFAGIEGTYTTEDFLKTYGSDVLKQVISAAFNELDPALASVLDSFSGTADEISAFANALLTFYDATKELPEEVKKNLTAALGTTQDSVGNITKIAGSMAVIFAADKVDLAKAASDAYVAANNSQFEALTAQGNALTDLIGKTDTSAAAADKLAQATVSYGNAAVAALAAIKQIAHDLQELTQSTLETINDSIRTDDERYSNWQSQIAAYETELKTATDPKRISELQKNIDDLTTKSWNMYLEKAGEQWKASHNWDQMTPEQQTASWTQFLNSMKGPMAEFEKVITDTDAWVQSRLTAIGGDVEKTAQQHLDDAADKMTQVAKDLKEAADKNKTASDTQISAANKQLNAANTPIRVDVNVDVNGPEVGLNNG